MIPSQLSKAEIERFSRQILLPEIGVQGQEKLLKGSVLIIGTGGLGSPSSLYLAASGVGRIGLVDYDTVDLSNIHRQILHNERRVGMSKVESAKITLQEINSSCRVETYNTLLTRHNAIEIIQEYDVIVDATDNAVTRYLVNDACVLLGKPLVSGAALRFDGQLTTYAYNGSPCYRCIYPIPPNAELVVNCDQGGVTGPVTGVIGSLQALEVIRIIAMQESTYAGKLLIFSGLGGTLKSMKLRPKSPTCIVCGDHPTITSDLLDYEMFCSARADDKTHSINILPEVDRISCQRFNPLYQNGNIHILDVRPAVQFDICRFEPSINIPFEELPKNLDQVRDILHEQKELIVVCRRGNDSQLAVSLLKEHGIQSRDLIGGLLEYAAKIDPSLPRY